MNNAHQKLAVISELWDDFFEELNIMVALVSYLSNKAAPKNFTFQDQRKELWN